MTQSKYASYGNYKHGMKGTRFYQIWKAMRRRCTNKSHEWYKNYGGKGVAVCTRWQTFANFRDDMHPSYLAHVARHSEKETSIDRIDSRKGYAPQNCKWSTREEQANNTVRNLFVEHEGKTQTIAQWARELGINYTTLYRRFKRTGGIIRLQGFIAE